MHPSLAPHLHSECLQIIEQLHRCHEEHPVSKFLGKCNDIKRALNVCLKEEDEYDNPTSPQSLYGKVKQLLYWEQLESNSLLKTNPKPPTTLLTFQDLRKRRKNLEEARRKRKKLQEFCSDE